MLCNSKPHLHEMLQVNLDGNGEGVVLRNPSSAYEHGRSDQLYKFKVPVVDCFGIHC